MARPPLDAHHVLVRITHSGICGTDYKIYSGAIPVSYPRVMGHEMVGEIVECGDAGACRPGDRVIVDPELYCGACFHCRIGQTHLCPNGMLIGRDTNGGFAEFVMVPAHQVFRLPDSIDAQTAPLVQVLTTCLHAQRQIDIFPVGIGGRARPGRDRPAARAAGEGARRHASSASRGAPTSGRWRSGSAPT